MTKNADDKKPVDDADIAKMTAAQDNADSHTVLPDDGSLEPVLADAIETTPPADADGVGSSLCTDGMSYVEIPTQDPDTRSIMEICVIDGS